MIDSSKLPIGRVDVLDNKLSDIDTTIVNNYNETNVKIDNVNEDLLEIIDGLTKRIQTLEARNYVKETWKSGESWYRIWNDGWIEQGGVITSSTDKTVTVTLLKPMTTTNYSVMLTETDATTISNNSRNSTLDRDSRTKTSFSCYHNRHTIWYAYGY